MRKRVKKRVCPNCNHPLKAEDNYCPGCGQENHTHQLPLKHFVLEFFESLFHFDTNLFRTVKDLFLHPGAVTKNYNDNKRARYVPPFRFYLFTSAIYFLVLAVFETPEVKVVDTTEKKSQQQDGVVLNTSGFTEEEKKELQQLAEKGRPTTEDLRFFLEKHGKEASWKNLIMARVAVQILKDGDRKEIGNRMLKNISYMMFLLMPLFALLLYLLYWRKKLFYSAQLVFSVHFHTLAFILLFFALMLTELIPNFDFSGITVLILVAYLFLSLKKVFEESWKMTLIKGGVLAVSYFVVCLFTLLGAMIVCVF